MGISDHLTYLLRNLYAGQEALVRTGLGTTDWFQIGKGVPRSHLAYLTYVQRTSYEMLGWMNHKLESRLNIIRKNINNLRYADGRNGRGTKEPLGEGKRGE